MGQVRKKREGTDRRTTLAHHAAALVKAVNAADAGLSEFVRSALSEAAIASSGAAPIVEILQRVRDQTGGIDLMETEPGDNPFVFRVRSRRGRPWARVYMFADKVQEDHLREFGFMPLLDPAAEKEAPWATRRMSEPGVVKEIHRHVDRSARHDEFSGVVLVAKKARVIYHRANGFAEHSFRAANRPNTKFHLGSANKMFTAIGIAQFVERGRLDFHTPLIEVLPEYPNPAVAKEIEIHHLLTHTAGLGGLFDRPGFDRARKYTWHADHFPIFADAPLLFPPGSRSAYSNEGFIVLGAVLERLASETYREYVRKNILRPAGMKDTDAYPLEEATPNRAVGYARFEDDPFALQPRRANWAFLGAQGNAAGGFYSTAPDLLRFARALLRNRFLSRTMTQTITSRQGLMPHYGYGFFVEDFDGREVIGHGGGGPNSGVNTELKIFRDGSYTVAVLSNYDAPTAQDLARRITEFLALQ
jgi:CubicO group peptidase (beta-lactamase class C family)